jgi:tetratricopeptide (TPR) repeat protein
MSDPQTEKTSGIDLPASAGAYIRTEAQVEGPAPRPLLPTTERYTLQEPIARGGMGIVYRATDTILDREVAIKVLQECFHTSPAAVQRFLDEARIAGQLQHPGIPAVHDLGLLPDGRPFLAMKLVKGRTLDALLEERASPVQERGRFVGIFEAICQAVGYAHAHNVIHRDLKPANIMVGAFGEVQVMDWGLAKVLGKSEPRPAVVESSAVTEIRMLRDTEGSETQTGSVMGTPAFMSPEQAIGAIERIDARSDVFSLGGLLLVILTGDPPFVGDSAEATRQLAARAKLDRAFASLDACGAELDLVTLCKRCLSPEPEDRPADAGAVARAVADLRAAADERARQAEVERARAEAETREQRKRRRVQLALLAAVGLLVCGGALVAWWQSEQARSVRQRQERNGEATAGQLDQCAEALQAGDSAGAAFFLEVARKRATEGGADHLAGRMEGYDADLAVLHELDRIDQIRWAPVENKWLYGTELARHYQAALAKFGADPESVSVDEAAARIARSAVSTRLITALDVCLVTKSQRVFAVLRQVDPHPFRDAIRDAVLAGNQDKIAELADRREAENQPPGFVVGLGETGAVYDDRLRDLLEIAVRKKPGNLPLIMALGMQYPVNQKDWANERLRWFQAAVEVAPTNPATHNSLGIALLDRGDREGAITEFREALRLDRNFAHSHVNLGWALQTRGKLDEAIAEFKEALRLDPEVTTAHANLGWVLQRKGDLTAASAAYKEALRLDPKCEPAVYHLPRVERMRELLPRLPDVLAGRDEPKTAAEAMDFATICGHPSQRRFVAAVRFAETAFARDPAIAEDLTAGHRYNAACYAVLATDTDRATDKLGPAERKALRARALAWLRADLTLTRKQATSSEPGQRKSAIEALANWFRDPDLASTLPTAARDGWTEEEDAAWNLLWADAHTASVRISKGARKPQP